MFATNINHHHKINFNTCPKQSENINIYTTNSKLDKIVYRQELSQVLPMTTNHDHENLHV